MLSQWLQQARNGRSVWLSDVRQDCEALPEHVAVTMQLTLTDGTRRDFSLPIPQWEGAEQRQFVQQYVTACVFNTLSALSGRELAFYLDLRETEAAALLGELDNIFQGHETADILVGLLGVSGFRELGLAEHNRCRKLVTLGTLALEDVGINKNRNLDIGSLILPCRV